MDTYINTYVQHTGTMKQLWDEHVALLQFIVVQVATATEQVLSWTLSWPQGGVRIAAASEHIKEIHVQDWVGVRDNGRGLGRHGALLPGVSADPSATKVTTPDHHTGPTSSPTLPGRPPLCGAGRETGENYHTF